MKHYITLFVCVLFALLAKSQTIRQFTISNSLDGQSKLIAFLPEHPTGRAIIDCPGGAYAYECMDYEGTDWATFFNSQGIAYFVLNYRLPSGNPDLPVSDAYQALKTVRDSATVWNINPNDVGIMGFSAGGHLASSVCTHAPINIRPNFSILFYPVITMIKGQGHDYSATNFLGNKRNDEESIKLWSNDQQVKKNLTPPTAIFLANDDGAVPPLTNGMAYYASMRRNGNDCSLYIFPSGGHGFGFQSNYQYHDVMLQLLSQWLQHLKAPKATAKRVACIGNSITEGAGIDLCQQNAYPAHLQKVLGDDYNVVNFGLSGHTLLNHGDCPYMKREVWHEALEFNPDIAIIKLGTNDSKPYNWKYGKEFPANLQEMIDSLKKCPSHPKIYLSTPIKAISHNYDINDSVIVNGIIPIIYKVAKKNKLPVIDLHELFPASEKDMLQSDGIHPTSNGSNRMAQIIGKAIIDSH
ncbi:MAG: acetylxylan esterase AxeA1 [Prevotella sp.]|jgi:acetyl esterase/lipase/lysophospholipase L1-like esterase